MRGQTLVQRRPTTAPVREIFVHHRDEPARHDGEHEGARVHARVSGGNEHSNESGQPVRFRRRKIIRDVRDPHHVSGADGEGAAVTGRGGERPREGRAGVHRVSIHARARASDCTCANSPSSHDLQPPMRERTPHQYWLDIQLRATANEALAQRQLTLFREPHQQRACASRSRTHVQAMSGSLKSTLGLAP